MSDTYVPLEDARVAETLLAALKRRDRFMSVCPSEIARILAEGKEWRELMPQVRRVLKTLLLERRVVLTRGTHVLTAAEIDGRPLRYRRGAQFDSRKSAGI